MRIRASQTAPQAGAGNPAMQPLLMSRGPAGRGGERDRHGPAGAAGVVEDPDREKDIPKIPLRCISGSGGGATSACGGGGGGAGKFSHFIEYTSWPSAVRPMGAQLSTRAVTLLGVNLVCDHAGDAINRKANRSFFIGLLSRNMRRPPLNRIGKGMSIALTWLLGERKPPSRQVRISARRTRSAPKRGSNQPLLRPAKGPRIRLSAGMFLAFSRFGPGSNSSKSSKCDHRYPE